VPCREIEDTHELRSLAGQEVAISDWLEITQERVNQFADATGDHQWIHVDSERAKRESPFGTTIAHGFLTLSLLPKLGWESLKLRKPPPMTINYGADRIRFSHPVKVGDRIRSRTTLLEMKPVDRGWRVHWRVTVDVEGAPKPALVAETITLYVT
jgi:acyl dehydratase